MTFQYLFQTLFRFVEFRIETQMKHRIHFPFFLQLFDSQSLEQVFPSEEISFERGKQQAFTETARAAQKIRFAGRYHFVNQCSLIYI